MSSCIFCDILARSAEASFIIRDDLVSAFLDFRPINPGRTLPVANQHVPALGDLDPRIGARLFETARRISRTLHASTLQCEGINLWLADGEAAMQDVFHVHLHVIPRHAGDGFRPALPESDQSMPGRSELDDIAATMKRHLT